MAISYKPLFTITVRHTYYEDQIPVSLSLTPSEDTLQNLKNHRLKLQARTGRITVYFQSLDGINPIIPLTKFTLRFFITVSNPLEFLNFTKLDTTKIFKGKKKIYFQNDPLATKEISHSIVDLVKPSIFTYVIPLVSSDPASENVDLELKHLQSGDTITIEDIPANEQGGFEQSIDLSGAKSGLYTFKSTASGLAGTEEEILYIDDDISKVPFFGLVEMDYESGTSLAEYELQFERKTSLWNIILVNKNSRDDFDSLLVKDNDPAVADPYQTYDFEKQEGTLTVSERSAVQFQSKTAIPFYERPKKGIELVKEVVDSSDLVILSDLSNPPIDQISSKSNESDIYVFV